MGKCWLFEETGEVRPPNKGEWFKNPYDCPTEIDELWRCMLDHAETSYSILSLATYDRNPLEPIREVWEKWKEATDIYEDTYSGQEEVIREIMIKKREIDLWQAIQKSMKIVEGK